MSEALRDAAYDQIDRYLRNNLDDADYADYSQALDLIYIAASPETASELRSLRDAIALARSHIGELDEQLLGYLDGLKFHPSASHVHPEYRDGFNHAIDTVSDRIRTERTLRAALNKEQP